MKTRCPNCGETIELDSDYLRKLLNAEIGARGGAVRDVEIVEREEKVTIKDKDVSFNAHYSRCLTCGDEFEAPGQLDTNLDAARETYARLYESPSN